MSSGVRGQELIKVLSRHGVKVLSLDIMLFCTAACDLARLVNLAKRGLQDLRAYWKTRGFKHNLQSWSRWDRDRAGRTFCELHKQHGIHLALLTMEIWWLQRGPRRATLGAGSLSFSGLLCPETVMSLLHRRENALLPEHSLQAAVRSEIGQPVDTWGF